MILQWCGQRINARNWAMQWFIFLEEILCIGHYSNSIHMMYSENGGGSSSIQPIQIQYAHSVDGQIKWMHILNVERLPLSGLPSCFLNAYWWCWSRNQEGQSWMGNPSLFPTHMHPCCCNRVQAKTVYQPLVKYNNKYCLKTLLPEAESYPRCNFLSSALKMLWCFRCSW